jgi:hypothetical protein
MTHNEQIDPAEYEELFPFEQEYNLWISGIEKDFADEIVHRTAIKIREKDRVSYSPYDTVNS